VIASEAARVRLDLAAQNGFGLVQAAQIAVGVGQPDPGLGAHGEPAWGYPGLLPAWASE
jgi:hypothetical protein